MTVKQALAKVPQYQRAICDLLKDLDTFLARLHIEIMQPLVSHSYGDVLFNKIITYQLVGPNCCSLEHRRRCHHPIGHSAPVPSRQSRSKNGRRRTREGDYEQVGGCGL